MARVYRVPVGFDPPELNIKTWLKDEEEYIERLSQHCKHERPGDDLAGELLRFGRGDGYALYMVAQSKPLWLYFLELGDAYSIESWAERGLTLADVRDLVRSERALRALFAKKGGE